MNGFSMHLNRVWLNWVTGVILEPLYLSLEQWTTNNIYYNFVSTSMLFLFVLYVIFKVLLKNTETFLHWFNIRMHELPHCSVLSDSSARLSFRSCRGWTLLRGRHYSFYNAVSHTYSNTYHDFTLKTNNIL